MRLKNLYMYIKIIWNDYIYVNNVTDSFANLWYVVLVFIYKIVWVILVHIINKENPIVQVQDEETQKPNEVSNLEIRQKDNIIYNVWRNFEFFS